MTNLLTNLATLKVFWDEGNQDLLGNFMPLVGYAIKMLDHPVVSEDELIEKIYEAVGFKMPRAAANILIRRASKQKYGYISRQQKNYVRNDEAVEKLDFLETKEKVERNLTKLKEAFRIFVRDTFSEEYDEEKIEYSFFDILYEMTPQLIEHIIDSRSKSLIEKYADNKSIEYKVSLFFNYCQRQEQEYLDIILSFVQGAVLSESFYYSNPETTTQKLRNVEIFFDTGMLILILELCDEEYAAPALELVSMLSNMNAKMRVFEKTVTELQGIFTAAEYNARYSKGKNTAFRPGDIFDFFYRKNYSASDIRLEFGRIIENLAKKGIKIEKNPPYVKELGVDESILNNYLSEAFGSEKPFSDVGRRHDIDCLSAIYRLRNGASKNYFESCDAIFVTTNNDLTKASQAFFSKEQDYKSDAPIAISDKIFTMLMWLKSVDKKPDLPKKQIVANSLAAMRPSDALWNKYLSEADKLQRSGKITEEDYLILAHSMESRTALMAFTEGDNTIVTEGTVANVLDKSKAMFIHETKLKYETTLISQKKSIDQTEKIITKISSASFVFTRYFINIGAVLFLIIAFFVTTPDTIPSISQIHTVLPAAAVSMFVLLLIVASILNLIFGTTIDATSRAVAAKVSQRISNTLRKRLLGTE